MVGAIGMIVTEHMRIVKNLQQNMVHRDTINISTDENTYGTTFVSVFAMVCCH